MRTSDHRGERRASPPRQAPARAASDLASFAAGIGNRAFAAIARDITITASQAAQPRVQDFVASLNAQSEATRYAVRGDRLVATPQRGRTPTDFDTRMQHFTRRRGPSVPLRFVRSSEESTMTDNLDSGRVDVDDLLSSGNESFRQSLIHFITERRATPNYRNVVGGTLPQPVFDAAHDAGGTAERDHLRRDLHDDSIGAGTEDAATTTKTYASALGYRVVHRYSFSGPGNQLMSGTVTVVRADGTTVGYDTFRAERQAAPRQRARRPHRARPPAAGHR
jgi:hypothetical protein